MTWLVPTMIAERAGPLAGVEDHAAGVVEDEDVLKGVIVDVACDDDVLACLERRQVVD